MAGSSTMPYLDAWYSHLTVEEPADEVNEGQTLLRVVAMACLDI
jgi:hypothetical protein